MKERISLTLANSREYTSVIEDVGIFLQRKLGNGRVRAINIKQYAKYNIFIYLLLYINLKS